MNSKIGIYRIILPILLMCSQSAQLFAVENADVIVARDGSGDYTTIQEAIDSIPTNNSALKIILIKNGVYNEKIRIDTDHIALVGTNRDSTRIEYYEPYVWDSTYAEIGRAVINIYANDITLANLTAENTQPETGIHAFTVYGTNNTRTIIIHCNILSNGGDTVSLWNGTTGMYYHNTCYFKGAVDFLCPRGWCYVENIEFYCTRKTTPLWHDGSASEDQKFVVKNASFDGAATFNLGRHHHDGAFYLINLVFSEKMQDQPFYRPESSPGPYQWDERRYFHNCIRPAGNYDWHKDNMITAKDSPMPEEVTPVWTFDDRWNPEETMPSVLPFAFLPKPDHHQIRVGLEPELTWVPGRNAESHDIYFGTVNPPSFAENTVDGFYHPGPLAPNTVYFWRVDAVTEEEVIEGTVWQFRTRTDQPPAKATRPSPADGAVDIQEEAERLLWHADSLETDQCHLYMGLRPDSLELVSSYSVPGFYPDALYMGRTYFWRIDLENPVGITQGDLWQFTMIHEAYTEPDYYQVGPDNLVSIETERFTENVPVGEHAWTLIQDPAGYSGNGAMQALPDQGAFFNTAGYSENSARLDYAVDFQQTGNHYLWIRGYTQGGPDNIFHVGLNGREVETASLIGYFTEQDQWEWINGSARQTPEIRYFDVSLKGVQRVSLWFGRDGAIADKIVLTTNPDYVPTGLGPDMTAGILSPEEPKTPVRFGLMQNFPNPFNSSTKVRFELLQESDVIVRICDIRGREIAILQNGRLSAGSHEVIWNGLNRAGQRVSSGLYAVQLLAGGNAATRKMILLQ